MGKRLPESRLITFEDAIDMMRVLSRAGLRLLRAVKAHSRAIGLIASCSPDYGNRSQLLSDTIPV
jgi:hypothetical protein